MRGRSAVLLASSVALVLAAVVMVGESAGRHPYVQPSTGGDGGGTTQLPTATLTSESVATPIIGAVVEPSGFTVAKWYDRSDVVAEVTVDSVGDPRFNTGSGLLPTPDATAPWNKSGLAIARPVTLRVVHQYTPDDEIWTGFVSSRVGGELEGVRYFMEPGVGFDEGAKGIVFPQASCWSPRPVRRVWSDRGQRSEPVR